METKLIMSITLTIEKQTAKMETAWKKGCYPYAVYWSRQNAHPQVMDYSARYKASIQAKYLCRDAAFYWKNFKLAKQALDEYSQRIQDDEQTILKQEIEIRETEAIALQQLESGDPHHPQHFTAFVSSYPKGRPNQEHFLKAVEDFQMLKYHHEQVLHASNFSQFASRILHGMPAVEKTVWKQYAGQVMMDWFAHFGTLYSTVKHNVHDHLVHADFEQAEQVFHAFEKQHETLLQILKPPQFNDDLHDEIIHLKETWEQLNQDIAAAIQDCRFEDAEDLTVEYENVFPKDNNRSMMIEQLKKRREQSNAVIAKLNDFKSKNRWKDAKSYLQINQKNIPHQKVPEYAQWIEQCQKRTFAFNTAAVVFILVVIFTVTYWFL